MKYRYLLCNLRNKTIRPANHWKSLLNIHNKEFYTIKLKIVDYITTINSYLYNLYKYKKQMKNIKQ